MNLEDIFFSRLKLMVIMGYGYLENFPLGERRRQALLENALYMAQTAIDSIRPPEDTIADHIFYQRIKLLAVMLSGVAKGFPMGEHRRTALRENLDSIRHTLMFSMPSEEDLAILKVA
ncbi:MAG: hypothetical protein HY911_15350 [Desulfobacterales bacterium]|nr:hypothetical protein [Desulfobacterales bacterium]